MSAKKADILVAIAALKKEQPPYWRSEVRKMFDMLEALEDPYAEHEYRGTERLGRHSLGVRIVPLREHMNDPR